MFDQADFFIGLCGGIAKAPVRAEFEMRFSYFDLVKQNISSPLVSFSFAIPPMLYLYIHTFVNDIYEFIKSIYY